MIPLKCATLQEDVHRCLNCGLEWHGLPYEEECPLGRLEEEFLIFEDQEMSEEDTLQVLLRSRPVPEVPGVGDFISEGETSWLFPPSWPQTNPVR